MFGYVTVVLTDIGDIIAYRDGLHFCQAYDYLVIALGSETKFFDMSDIEKHALTIKSWNDAIVIRNHIIHQLEQAELRAYPKTPALL